MKSTAIVILAAGASVRFGAPKQLATIEGTTLIRRAAETALRSGCGSVVAVLGANAARVEPELAGLPVVCAFNSDWESGMGTSIAAGMKALSSQQLEAVILTVCDQPFVSADLLNDLVRLGQSTCKGIVASEYADTRGVPTLFAARYFPELSSLKGKEGAKKVIEAHAEDVACVPFPQGDWDIDCIEDLERLNSRC
jgi:molybdenum cofactor cytidylyltransferase